MSNIRKFFNNRWKKGRIVEMDFSQLEVVVLAALSQDDKLIEDLNNGFDMHLYFAWKLDNLGASFAQYQENYWLGINTIKLARRIAKQCTFQLQYGASAGSMARKLDVSVDVTKKFINEYYTRYPKVKKYQDKTHEYISKQLRPSSKRTTKGYPAKSCKVQSPTGRIYTFTESDSPSWMKEKTSLSPTVTKNYFIQGTAYDIVAYTIGELYELLKGVTNVLMINTVHDSIMFDCENEEAAMSLIRTLKLHFEDLTTRVENFFGIKLSVPLKIEYKTGKSYGELT